MQHALYRFHLLVIGWIPLLATSTLRKGPQIYLEYEWAREGNNQCSQVSIQV